MLHIVVNRLCVFTFLFQADRPFPAKTDQWQFGMEDVLKTSPNRCLRSLWIECSHASTVFTDIECTTKKFQSLRQLSLNIRRSTHNDALDLSFFTFLPKLDTFSLALEAFLVNPETEFHQFSHLESLTDLTLHGSLSFDAKKEMLLNLSPQLRHFSHDCRGYRAHLEIFVQRFRDLESLHFHCIQTVR